MQFGGTYRRHGYIGIFLCARVGKKELSFWYRQYNYHIMDVEDSLFLFLGNSDRIYEYEIKTDTIKVYKSQSSHFTFCSEIVIERNRKFVMVPYGNNRIFEYEYDSGVFADRKCEKVTGTIDKSIILGRVFIEKLWDINRYKDNGAKGKMIEISFLVPAYNQSEEIKKCVSSIIEYKGRDIEVVLNDDCSEERLDLVVEKLYKNDVRYL